VKSKSLQAINPKHQTLVNRCVSWLNKHNEFDKLRNIADGEGDYKTYRKWDKKCIYTFNKYVEYRNQLPLREILRLERFTYEQR